MISSNALIRLPTFTPRGLSVSSENMAPSVKTLRLCAWLLILVSNFSSAAAHAQQTAEPTKPAPEAIVTAPIPLVDIVTESESVAASLRDIER